MKGLSGLRENISLDEGYMTGHWSFQRHNLQYIIFNVFTALRLAEDVKGKCAVLLIGYHPS